jgi:hypothetical protein
MHHLFPAALPSRGLERHDQIGCRGETHLVTVLSGEIAERNRQMCLADETGRMAPMLYHGLRRLGLPIVCIESRRAYQALKSLTTQKTDRDDARGLAHLAGTGFFKPVYVKSLPAHARRSLIIARKKWSASGSRWRTRSAVSPCCSA